MEHVRALECVACGETYPPEVPVYTCERHPGTEGVLDVRYDDDALAERLDLGGEGVWRYGQLLPLPEDADQVALGAGGTPLLDADRLGAELGVDLRLKDERANPTGSVKDRAGALSATLAGRAGFESVTCASTGNAAASLAAYAARAGLGCRLFVPESAPEGKLTQPLAYGADVFAVGGSYDDAFEVSVAATEAFGWYNRNAGVDPYQVEGMRTLGHELAESGPVPDWLVLPMGNGCTLSAAWKGFREFDRLGVADGTPRMLGVQAEGASAIRDAFHGEEPDGGTATAADSLAVGTPHSAERACRALDASGGTAVAVGDDAILDAVARLGRTEGVYAEPAGAAPVAGLRAALERGVVDPGDSVVVVVTGDGLKDAASGRAATGGAVRVDPDLAAVRRYYE